MYDASKAVLLIDAGNTRIKFVYYESLSCRTPEGLPKSNKFILTHDEIERLSERLGQFNKKPTLVIGVNVAGSIIAAKISKQLRLHHGAGTYEQYWLSSQPQLLHLKNAYIDASQLGSDRWLARGSRCRVRRMFLRRPRRRLAHLDRALRRRRPPAPRRRQPRRPGSIRGSRPGPR